MATDRSRIMTCSLCRDFFTSPKLLSCSHTFCEKCLKDLSLQHTESVFPCPTCNTEITVPPGGVSAFLTNDYIDPKELLRARNTYTYCRIHTDKELEWLCNVCDQTICLSCKVTVHEGHETQVLTEPAEFAQKQLCDDNDRVKNHMMEINLRLRRVQQECTKIKDKQSALQTAIHNRHATLQIAIDRYRDKALASLNTVTCQLLEDQEKEKFSQEASLQELTNLQELIQHALDNENPVELIAVAREMTCGRGSEEAVLKLTTKQMTTVCRPVLHFSATPDATLQRMRDYMGSAAKMEMAVSAPEVTVVEQFRCREDPDTDVYYVCPLPDDQALVSYEPYVSRDAGCLEVVAAGGNSFYECKNPERKTMVRTWSGTILYPKSKLGSICTYAKKYNVYTTGFFLLANNLTGQATIQTDELESEEPLQTKITDIFTLHCAAHRAFDVDASEKLFVVLEEGKTPDWQRRVQLYRRNKQKPIATYSPPVAPFQPSDVCFYTLGGQEVLLVADELNDAIHVVNVQDGRLSFARTCPRAVRCWCSPRRSTRT